MSQEHKDMFTKISNLEDRVHLAEDLVRLKGELIVKAQKAEDIFRLEAARLSKTKLVCLYKSGQRLPVLLPADVVVSFNIATSRFFLTSALTELGGGYFEIDFSGDVFQLQRRQNYRIRIPPNYKSLLEVNRLNGTDHDLTGALWDISNGGVRIVLDHDQPVLKENDTVEGELAVGKRAPFPFRGRVRHVKIEKSPQIHQIVGVEFTNLTPALEGKLFSITMELHRELFARWV